MRSARPVGAYSPAAGPGSRHLGGQAAVIGVVLAFAGIAWIATDLRMPGMDAGPGTDPGVFGFHISTWVVMMAAMMLPAIAPMVAAFHLMQGGARTSGSTRSPWTTTVSLAGYLAVWSAAGLIGYLALEAGRSLDGGLFAWDRLGRWTVVTVLLIAATYQLTRAKRACLSRCHERDAFLREPWRGGSRGALLMGSSTARGASAAAGR